MAEKTSLLPFVHFSSGGHDYVIELRYVKEILRMAAITRVEELPDFVKGVINLRGDILPVIDFLSRSGIGVTPITLKKRIMVLKLKSLSIGVLVDTVKETLEVSENDVSRNIQSEVIIDPKYIVGTFVHDGQLMLWVDTEKLFTDNEMHKLEEGLAHA
jgi:purine-binding chemotaxis protein CheW